MEIIKNVPPKSSNYFLGGTFVVMKFTTTLYQC